MATARKTATAAKVTLYNPGPTPVVYSEQGHILGSAERREVGVLDESGARAVAQGLLVNESEQAKDAGDGAPESADQD
jgi:hypothetical protein